jgi:hypothetical protein
MDREAIQGIRTAKRLDDKLLECKGVVGVDVDYKQVKGQKTDAFSITVYVKKKIAKEELSVDEAVPAEIEGIPTDVVECSNVWPSQESLEMRADAQVTVKQEKTAVLEGGLSISNQYNLGSYGTLGIVLYSQNKPTALSCAHVMVSPPPQPGQGVIEPGGPQGGTYPADSIGKVSVADYGPHNVDAALVLIVGRASNVATVLQIGKVNGFGMAFVGQQVKKMGVRTGFTQGVVSSTTFTFKITSPLGSITLYNQIRIDGQFALPGDSGAAVIDNNNYMVGMVEGGNDSPPYFTVCNTSADLQRIIPSLNYVQEQE